MRDMCLNCSDYKDSHGGTHAPNCCCPDCPDNSQVEFPSYALDKLERGNPDLEGYPKWDVATDVAINPSLAPAVNNHVCPKCKNDRCSLSEKKCWLCGEVLFVPFAEMTWEYLKGRKS